MWMPMAIYGPFEKVEREGDVVRIYVDGVKPTSPSRAEPYRYAVELQAAGLNIVERNGLYFLEGGRNTVLESFQRILGGGVVANEKRGSVEYAVIPVIDIEVQRVEDGYRHVFHGFLCGVDLSRGSVVDVKGLGVYERFVPAEMVGRDVILPARLVKSFDQLSDSEKVSFLSRLEGDVVRVLHRAGEKELVSMIIASKIRRNPATLARIPRDILESYMDEENMIVRQAMMEATPEQISYLEMLLKSKTMDATKISYIYQRMAEEMIEEEVLREASRDPIDEHLEGSAIRRHDFTLDGYKKEISEVMKITLPITIKAPAYRTPERRSSAQGARETVKEPEKVRVGV